MSLAETLRRPVDETYTRDDRLAALRAEVQSMLEEYYAGEWERDWERRESSFFALAANPPFNDGSHGIGMFDATWLHEVALGNRSYLRVDGIQDPRPDERVLRFSGIDEDCKPSVITVELDRKGALLFAEKLLEFINGGAE